MKGRHDEHAAQAETQVPPRPGPRRLRPTTGVSAAQVCLRWCGWDVRGMRGVQQHEALGLQTKLKVYEPGDIYEQEQTGSPIRCLASPVHSAVSSAPLSIQRVSAHRPGSWMRTRQRSRALASPGRPLDPALRQDMEQRFRSRLFRVRVHTDGAPSNRHGR